MPFLFVMVRIVLYLEPLFFKIMKSEDKIIELLADYLKKNDQLLDRMDRTDRSVDIMSKAILEHSIKFNKTSAEIKQLHEEQLGLREDQRQMRKDQLGLREDQVQMRKDQLGLREDQVQMRKDQGKMLKELISLSKRVSSVEKKR
jgi:hypothetical protein